MTRLERIADVIDDIYRRLAGVLDTLPNGFPATDNGVEIDLLKKIFTPEQADLFCDLRLEFETAAAVAELVFGLIISLDRRIAHNVNHLREGVWNKKEYSKARGLKGSTLGIVGLGNVGQHVAARARAFDMRVVYFDTEDRSAFEEEHGLEKVSLEELLTRSDFVTLHAALTPRTRRLIGKEALANVKPGVRIINAARGGLIDEPALVAALEKGVVAGAALDVLTREPPDPDNPLLHMDNVIVTPHLGASTVEAQREVGMQVVQQVDEHPVLRQLVAVTAVNIDDTHVGTHIVAG